MANCPQSYARWTAIHFILVAVQQLLLLCTVAQSTVTKQHGCQSLGCGLKSRGFGIGAAIRRTNLCFSLSPIMFPNSFGRL